MADLREEILGQCSDDPGEGFEQRPVDTDEGNLYVSYWNSGDDYFLCTDQGMGSGPPPSEDSFRKLTEEELTEEQGLDMDEDEDFGMKM